MAEQKKTPQTQTKQDTSRSDRFVAKEGDVSITPPPTKKAPAGDKSTKK